MPLIVRPTHKPPVDKPSAAPGGKQAQRSSKRRGKRSKHKKTGSQGQAEARPPELDARQKKVLVPAAQAAVAAEKT